MENIKNAMIESVSITNDDHGMLSAWIKLDYGGSQQGFGGYSLYIPKDFRNFINQKNFAGHFIWRVMEVAGVHEWSMMVGKTVRAKIVGGTVVSIGHIIKDIWFEPNREFREMGEE